MKKVFIGLLFLFLDIAINWINILPSFVGYILIFQGLRRERECPSGKTTEYIAVVGAVTTGILWLLSICEIGIPLPIGAVFQLLITYRLVLWVEELTAGGDRVIRFRKSWYVLIVGVILGQFLALLGSYLSLVSLLVGLGAAVYYIYNYYRIWKDREGSESQESLQP